MKIILLVFLLVPIFAFQVFIIVNTISSLRVPSKIQSPDMEDISFNGKSASRKPNLRIMK